MLSRFQCRKKGKKENTFFLFFMKSPETPKLKRKVRVLYILSPGTIGFLYNCNSMASLSMSCQPGNRKYIYPQFLSYRMSSSLYAPYSKQKKKEKKEEVQRGREAHSQSSITCSKLRTIYLWHVHFAKQSQSLALTQRKWQNI